MAGIIVPGIRGGGLAVRPLTHGDLGLPESAIVQGTFAVRGGKATAYVQYLGAPEDLGRHLLGARTSLVNAARAEGASKLRIETTPVIEITGRLRRILLGRGFEERPNATMFWEGAVP
jgi:hypothetical protein